ncbi:MAG: hypothetical protein SGILL_004098 [Bacillariaceae sp.]
MFGDDINKELSASEESSSVGSSTLGSTVEDEDADQIYEAGDDDDDSQSDDDDDESSDEGSYDDDDDEDDEDESYVDGSDEDLFEEDDDEEEEDSEEDDDDDNSEQEKTTIEGAAKSQFSSMESAHSFASEATEERAHVSSPRAAVLPPKKEMVISPFTGKRGTMQVDDIPPTPPKTFSVAPLSVAVTPRSPKSPRSATSPRSASTTSSPPASPSPRAKKMMAKRTPGGGAAKLIGRPADDDFQPADDGDDKLQVDAPVEELMESRDKAKAEFSLGSTTNRRYHTQENDGSELKRTMSNAKMPSILTRSEVFHENAAAAVAALLSPAYGYEAPPAVEEIASKLSSKSGELAGGPGGVLPKKGKKQNLENPFYAPRRTDQLPSVPSARSDGSGGGVDTLPSNSPLVQKLLNRKLDRRLDVIKNRMKDPSKNLTDLMTAIVSPVDGNADRHYMVRRKNACGALKVMTANKAHRVNIAWTVGVLPALTSVLDDSGPETLEGTYPDLSTRKEFIEARKRAVAGLLNLSLADDNRIPMFHCPKLVASLIRVINQDDAEARRGSCMIMMQLTRSKDNKYLMAQVPGLVDAVTAVIDPKATPISESKDSDEETDTTKESDAFDRVTKGETPVSKNDVLSKATISEDVAEASAKYDEDPNEFIHGSRQHAFALLGNLAKEQDNAFILARHVYLVDTIVAITKLQESASQEYGLKLLAHFSRHRGNSKHLVFKMKQVVPAVVYATQSENDESRKYACFTLQNFSQDKPCRQELASNDELLSAVCRRIRSSRQEEEKLAALNTLKNLTDEPANLIPMTNTPECFATLMQVAHASDESVTETMQYIGCDALATLSHWFRSIATSGQRIGTKKRNSEQAKDQLFVPALRVVTFEPWQ